MSLLKDDVWILVTIMDKEEKLFMPRKATAAFVLYRCLSLFKIKECKYFTLFYIGTTSEILKESEASVFDGNTKLKNLLKLNPNFGNQHAMVKLRVSVMCHPPCVTKVSDLSAIKIIYHSVKSDVASGRLPCSSEELIYLAACAFQADFGKYQADQRQRYLKETSSGRIVPIAEVKLLFGCYGDFLDKVICYWIEFEDWSILKSQLKYLRRAQSLSQYGVHYFEGINKNKSKVHLGVTVNDLRVFPIDSKKSPKAILEWEHIGSLQVNNSKFIIKCVRRRAAYSNDVTIQCGSFRAAKRILQYAMMHHHFYLLITTPSEFHVRGADNNRGRRLQQKDVAVSSTRADLKFDTLREIMSSNDSFFSQRSYTFMMEEALASKIPRSLSQHDGKTRGRLKKLNRSDIVNTDKHPNISKKSITVAEKNSANIAEGTGCNDRLELKEARGNRSDQTAGRKSEVCLLDDCLNQLGLVDIRNDKSRTVQVTAEIPLESTANQPALEKSDPNEYLSPVSALKLLRQNSTVRLSRVEGIVTPVKPPRRPDALRRSANRLTNSAESKATRGSLEEFNPRASQLYKERAESSFASLIENFDSRKYLQSNALEQLRPRIEFERSLMQIKDLSDDEVHDETESFVNLEISVLRSVDHNRRSRSLQPCIDRRIICDDQNSESSHTKIDMKYRSRELSSGDVLKCCTPIDEKRQMRRSITRGNTLTRVQLFEDR